jgi:hypothetical protein
VLRVTQRDAIFDERDLDAAIRPAAPAFLPFSSREIHYSLLKERTGELVGPALASNWPTGLSIGRPA